MENVFEILHLDMLADISRCLQLDHPEKENAENCFWIARNYWEQLQKIVSQRGFANEEAEISFYRTIKPKFASYIEYFSLLSEGLMFMPPWIPLPESMKDKVDETEWLGRWQETVSDYWKHETKRGERFYGKNKVFLDYCESGYKDDDHLYFLSRNCVANEMSQRRSHNRDTELFTIHEELLTTWEAYKLYGEYIKKKINEPAHS